MKKVILLICLAMFCFGQSPKLKQLERACNNKNYSSCREVGEIYLEAGLDDVRAKIEPDARIQGYKEKAFEYYKRACEGDGDSCQWLANMYSGWVYDKEPDYQKMLEYHVKGCDLGNATACHSAALFYDTGYGTERDCEKALEYSLKGCDLNYLASCSQVSDAYTYGVGTEMNPSKAMEYYQKACDLGAKYNLCSDVRATVYYKDGSLINKKPWGCEKMKEGVVIK